jgi:hypothetical protein
MRVGGANEEPDWPTTDLNDAISLPNIKSAYASNDAKIYYRNEKVLFKIESDYFALHSNGNPINGVIKQNSDPYTVPSETKYESGGGWSLVFPYVNEKEDARGFWECFQEDGFVETEVEEDDKDDGYYYVDMYPNPSATITTFTSNGGGNRNAAELSLIDGDNKMSILPDGTITVEDENGVDKLNVWEIVKDLKEIKKKLTNL